MDIVSRREWGARPPRSQYRPPDKPTENFLHHSVGYGRGGASYMRQMQNQHMDDNGWSDIAYNHVIDGQTNVVYEGRGWGVAPGAQKGYNVGTWAVCVMGNYNTTTPTNSLLETISELIVYGNTEGHIRRVLTGGHRDAPGQSTSCPGDKLHSQIPVIRKLLTGQEVEVAKIPLESWARPAFQFFIDEGIYTQEKNLDKIREEYDFQRTVVNDHRQILKYGVNTGGAPHDHDGVYVKNVIVSR